MSDDIGFIRDHAQSAWDRFLTQHINKRQTENFVKSFYGPLNILEDALHEMYVNRWINTARGKQLDGCGSIVGIGREVADGIYREFFGFASQVSGRGFGVARIRRRLEPWTEMDLMGDEEYRLAIIAKIAFNNGHGTTEELIATINYTLKVDRTWVQDFGNATVRIYVNEFIFSHDSRYVIMSKMIPAMAGVKWYLLLWDSDRPFGFANNNHLGFGEGILARAPGSNLRVV